MCGRFSLHTTKKKLAEAISLAIPEIYEPSYNIGPGREVLSIAQGEDAPEASMMHWGLRTPQNFHVNARVETADSAPRFRDSWENHRCLVPASGFFEWYADGIKKHPYYFYPKDAEVCFLAGLWYPAPRSGEPSTCLLLTTEANASVRSVHHRMPILLPYEQRDGWLGNSLSKPEVVELANGIQFEKHTVSQRVNSVQNNDNGLIEATSPLSDDQMMLF